MKKKGTLLTKLFNSDKGKGPDLGKWVQDFDCESSEELKDFLKKMGLLRQVLIKYEAHPDQYKGGLLGAFVGLYEDLCNEIQEITAELDNETDEKLALQVKYEAATKAIRDITDTITGKKKKKTPPPIPGSKTNPPNALVPTKKSAKAGADEKREYNDNDKKADLLKIKENCITLESRMNKIIIGQEAGIREVSRVVKSGFNVLSEKLPVVIYIHGPTGIGKTFTAEELNNLLFEGLAKVPELCRIQGEIYDRDHKLSGLIGTSQGYVGYEDDGKLITNARENPYSVVLFDEIEKMALKCQRVLLGLLSTGQIQSAKGETIDCSNHVLILTSNIGEKDIANKKHLGFGNPSEEEKRYDAENHIKKLLKQKMDPELIGRISNFAHYFPLTEPHLRTILENKLNNLEDRAFKNTNGTGQLYIQKGAREQLYRLSVPKLSYGARSMNQVLERYLIANYQIDSALSSGNTMIVDFKEGKFTYDAVPLEKAKEILGQGNGNDSQIEILEPVSASELPPPPPIPEQFKK